MPTMKCCRFIGSQWALALALSARPLVRVGGGRAAGKVGGRRRPFRPLRGRGHAHPRQVSRKDSFGAARSWSGRLWRFGGALDSRRYASADWRFPQVHLHLSGLSESRPGLARLSLGFTCGSSGAAPVACSSAEMNRIRSNLTIGQVGSEMVAKLCCSSRSSLSLSLAGGCSRRRRRSLSAQWIECSSQ